MESFMASVSSNIHGRTVRLIFVPVFIGMSTAQAIATLFVYLSDRRIHAAADAIEKAGLLSIPTGPVKATLMRFGAAFWGGLFYTLSIGIGLTLATWALVRLWDLVFSRHPKVLYGYGAIWVAVLILVNIKGWALFPTLFCLLVPAVTAAAAFWGLRITRPAKSMAWLVPVVTLVVLTALWSTQLNADLFTAIRDHILLSNPVGRVVNDFYYRYTLYAAEAFKSFEQKTVRIGRLEGIPNERSDEEPDVIPDAKIDRRLQNILARNDVLVLKAFARPDIVLHVSRAGLELVSNDGEKVRTGIGQFMSAPGVWLRKYSEAADRFAPFRKMTLFGLLIGFPVLLFTLVYGVLQTIVGTVATERRTVWIASALCLGAGILLFLPMLSAGPDLLTDEGVRQALTSDHWTRRVAALRHIEDRQMEIARFPAYRRLLTSRRVVERYWLARALAKSRVETTYAPLLTLLNDPHPNVVCQACYALGERGQRRAIQPIKDKLVRSDHWYVQWYGYRALRRLGWYQVPSEQRP
jgi:hypothetical protein